MQVGTTAIPTSVGNNISGGLGDTSPLDLIVVFGRRFVLCSYGFLHRYVPTKEPNNMDLFRKLGPQVQGAYLGTCAQCSHTPHVTLQQINVVALTRVIHMLVQLVQWVKLVNLISWFVRARTLKLRAYVQVVATNQGAGKHKYLHQTWLAQVSSRDD